LEICYWAQKGVWGNNKSRCKGGRVVNGTGL
jgi:hypothetical protein